MRVLVVALALWIPFQAASGPVQGSIFDPWDFAPQGDLRGGTLRDAVLERSSSGAVEIAVYCYNSVHFASAEFLIPDTGPVAILSWGDIVIDRPISRSGYSDETRGTPLLTDLPVQAGASYGGRGFNGPSPYGDRYLDDLHLGSMGRNWRGGGALGLMARGRIIINQPISCNGYPPSGNLEDGHSSGSGGSILLAAPEVINNSTLSARGGRGQYFGGGGRIAIYGHSVVPGLVELSPFGTVNIEDQVDPFASQENLDVNRDDRIDAADVTTLINHINGL